MDYHLNEIDAVLNNLKSSEKGISLNEAKQRLQNNGKNELAKQKSKPLILKFLSQICDPMIIILIVAAAISAFLAILQNNSFTDVIIILAVVVVNAILGVYQENKAEKSLEALKQMSASKSRVIRDGKICEIFSTDIVVGDVVVLNAGDSVPADGRIISSSSLKIEESSLTGESEAVDKINECLYLKKNEKIVIADRTNMVYMGTVVVYGRGAFVVTATGMNTEIGKIAGALQDIASNKTPLQIKMAQLSKILTWLVVTICVCVFTVQLIRSQTLEVQFILDSFMIAVTLAVAAIPEGLPAIVTVALSVGVSKMAKRNAIVRKLTAVETLGCAQIICSDKTGTLTQNKMTVVEYFGNESMLKKAMGLCNDATEDSGEATELALYKWSKISKENFPRTAEIPFDSNRKLMSTLHMDGDTSVQFTKGAPDAILALCPNADVEKILDINKKLAKKSLRVLACAYRVGDSIKEENLEFIGLVGMKDPVRQEVKGAIEKCEEAGIRPIMITGDHIDTARAVAEELGILDKSSKAITGSELDAMSEQMFDNYFADISVYARVQPEHKTRIVKAWQKAGYVVAMTGDGVNDAPSIKNADIGIGMGLTGTDVTKNVADMVLSDDNFATIVGAVEEGRRIYDNILKCIQYLLSSNIGEVLCVFFATIFGFVILRPVHLLWVNLVTDCVPALALGIEHKEPGIMKRKPRDKNDGIFASGVAFDIIYQGFFVTALIIVSYFVGHYIEFGNWNIGSSEHGITMAFVTMSMVGCFHSLNLRSRRQSIFKLKKQNWILLISVLLSLILTTMVCEVPPIAEAFKLTEIGILEWSISVGLGLLIIPIVEIFKFFIRNFEKIRNLSK